MITLNGLFKNSMSHVKKLAEKKKLKFDSVTSVAFGLELKIRTEGLLMMAEMS